SCQSDESLRSRAESSVPGAGLVAVIGPGWPRASEARLRGRAPREAGSGARCPPGSRRPRVCRPRQRAPARNPPWPAPRAPAGAGSVLEEPADGSQPDPLEKIPPHEDQVEPKKEKAPRDELPDERRDLGAAPQAARPGPGQGPEDAAPVEREPRDEVEGAESE